METTASETPKRTIYLANRSGDIVAVDIEHETAKQYRLDHRNFRNVRGNMYFVPRIIAKSSSKHNIFEDMRAAQEFVLADMRSDLEGAHKRIQRLTHEIAAMEKELGVAQEGQ